VRRREGRKKEETDRKMAVNDFFFFGLFSHLSIFFLTNLEDLDALEDIVVSDGWER